MNVKPLLVRKKWNKLIHPLGKKLKMMLQWKRPMRNLLPQLRKRPIMKQLMKLREEAKKLMLLPRKQLKRLLLVLQLRAGGPIHSAEIT